MRPRVIVAAALADLGNACKCAWAIRQGAGAAPLQPDQVALLHSLLGGLLADAQGDHRGC